MYSLINLFGTTGEGGAGPDAGTVFEVAAGSGSIPTLASFNGHSDGDGPVGGLVEDGFGNLFGVTGAGGAFNYGTVFEVSAASVAAGNPSITTLVSFNSTNGSGPDALVEDSNGNLFGTTDSGGASNEGTVFDVSAASTQYPHAVSLAQTLPGYRAVGEGRNIVHRVATFATLADESTWEKLQRLLGIISAWRTATLTLDGRPWKCWSFWTRIAEIKACHARRVQVRTGDLYCSGKSGPGDEVD